jgi:hypothetical protein
MSSGGRRVDLLGPTARKAFVDPWFAASIGVLFTFATSPLLWPHYLVLALIPIFWLFRRNGRADAGTWCAAICYVILTRLGIDLLIASGDVGSLQVVQVVTLFSWVALVPGVFAYVSEQHRALQAA